MPESPPIDVRGITKTFKSQILRRPRSALVGLDLTVEESEIFGFLGPNGAGKTTTIRILLGLIRPTAGRGTVLGSPFGTREARRDLGFVPDTPSFYRYLTGREFLEFTGQLHGLGGGALRRRIEETFDRVGLSGEARGRALKTYSRGMLQRTGIAAAILHRPRLVVLDEPMNGLDPLGRREFRDLLLSLKSEGCTVFLSSHVLADIESTADRVGILDRGRLIRCGPLEEILSGGDRGVEISFELPSTAGLDALAASFETLREGARGWIATAADASTGMEAVRRILEGGGRLLGYQKSRLSLEDFFLHHVSAPRSVDPLAPSRAQPGRIPRPESGSERCPPAAAPEPAPNEAVRR